MLDDAVTLQADSRPGVREPAAVVRAYQEELLRAAYLLTGNAERAARLAAEAAHALLRPLLRTQEEREWRSELLGELAGSYLGDAPAAEAVPLTPFITALDGGPARYSVDDERSRMWAALERCEPRQRLALVLRDFDQLDEEQVCGLVHRPPAELRGWLNTARERLRDAAGARHDQSAQALLLALSLGAPRVDLWLELAEPAHRIAEQERRRRQLITGGLAAALLLAVLAGAFWLAGGWLRDDDGEAVAAIPTATLAPLVTPTPQPSATPTRPPMVRPIADVPDVQLINYSYPTDARPPTGATYFYDSVAGVRGTVEGYSSPVGIAPDGSRLFYMRVETDPESNAVQSSTLVCVDAATGAVLWEQSSDSTMQPAVLNDRVISFAHDPGETEPPLLVVHDSFDGGLLQSVELDALEISSNSSDTLQAFFYLTPDLSRLHLVLAEWDQISGLERIVVLTFALPDLTPLDEVVVELNVVDPPGTNSFPLWNARLTPDGDAIYGLVLGEESPRLDFLDLTNGERRSLELPISVPEQAGGWPVYHVAGSHDGQRLYVISNTGTVAVFDLVEERVTETFPLDTAGHLFPANDATGWLWGVETSIFSADGRRLYLFDVWSGMVNPADERTSSTVWVVDVEQWRVVERWDVPGVVVSVSADAATSRLYLAAATVESQGGAQTSYRYGITELDTASGAMRHLDVGLPVPEQLNGVWLLSLQQLYRQKYGVTPPSGGIVPVDLPEYTTLPRLEIDVSDALPAAGQQVRFTIRFLYPLTGASVTDSMLGVRFDSSATVTLTLSHPELADVIVFPLRTDTATFEAAIPVERHGPWQATVTVMNPDGTAWSQRRPAIINVTPSFEAEDGRRYQFRLLAEPAEPVTGEPVTLRVVLVDVESGAPLPDSVGFDNGLPEEIDVSFIREDSAFKSATLSLESHGVYTTETTFPWTGNWQAELSFRVPGDDGPPVRVSGGALDVVGS